MRNFQTKTDNTAPSTTGRYSADEFNSLMQELERIALSAGRTLDGPTGPDTSLTMLAQAISSHASGGVFGIDTGGTNAYVINTPTTFSMPHALFHGMCAKFYASGDNTGAATLNAWGLGTKKLLDHTGALMTGGEIIANRLVEALYDPSLDGGAGAWRLAPWANNKKLGAIDPGSEGGDTGLILRTLVFSYTGADQDYVVPSGVSSIKVKAWGAGSFAWNWVGAVGGYTEGTLAVTPTTAFKVMVGQCGNNVTTTSDGVTEFGAVSSTTYGFGGAASDDTAVINQDGGVQGGGLTGLFTGSGAILATDTARARIVAGGAGGQVINTENSPIQGSNGNSATSGGMPSMQGASAADFAVERGGGGGGYAGGVMVSNRGRGGSGYTHASVTSPSIQFTADGGTTVPNASDVNYAAPVGEGNVFATGHGRLVIIEYA